MTVIPFWDLSSHRKSITYVNDLMEKLNQCTFNNSKKNREKTCITTWQVCILYYKVSRISTVIINSIFQSPCLGENGILVCIVWIEQNYDQSSRAEVEQLSANCRDIHFERERRFSSWKQYNIVLFISLSYINSPKNSISFWDLSFVHYFVLRIINSMAKPYSTII